MEHKPKFCSECGARLTGSAAFCPECGAKQEFASAPAVKADGIPEAATVVIPPIAPQAAAAPKLDTAPPVAAPKLDAAPPVAVPVVSPVLVAAPETSLAAPKKAKLSVVGLILVIAAVITVFLAEVFYLRWLSLRYTYTPTLTLEVLGKMLRNPGIYTGLLTAWVLPLIAILPVVLKKKPVAWAGVALAGLILLAQLLLTVAYGKLTRGQVPALLRILPVSIQRVYNWINGEELFHCIRWIEFLSFFPCLCYWLKNILALLACLMAAVKKQK